LLIKVYKIHKSNKTSKTEQEARITVALTAALKTITRSSADADNRLDAFSGQSRSTNMVPFHM